jgi:hypothetical protein
LSGGRIVLSHDVSQLDENERMLIIKQVLVFNDFTEDNDPYQEHDFGSFKHKGKTLYFKIDYYARGSGYMEGSKDPSNAELTARVLTIMFADEY